MSLEELGARYDIHNKVKHFLRENYLRKGIPITLSKI